MLRLEAGKLNPILRLARVSAGRTPYPVAVLVWAALLPPASASAREPTLEDLQPLVGRVVTIETNDRPQVVARLISAGDSALVASVGGVETRFAEREVRSVAADVDSMRTGLFIGIGVGVFGAIYGSQGLNCSCPGKTAAGAVFSLTAFPALGAFIGKHHHRRVTVYRRP